MILMEELSVVSDQPSGTAKWGAQPQGKPEVLATRENVGGNQENLRSQIVTSNAKARIRVDARP
jgi:hypothetical protein